MYLCRARPIIWPRWGQLAWNQPLLNGLWSLEPADGRIASASEDGLGGLGMPMSMATALHVLFDLEEVEYGVEPDLSERLDR
jgi:hypothetical protein